MKKNQTVEHSYWIRLLSKLLIVNLKILFLVCLLNPVYASGFPQPKKMNVEFVDQKLTSVLEYLRENTGYEFVYRKDILKADEKVTLELKDATTQQVLDAVLKSRGYDYEIVNQVVVIKKAASLPQEQKPQVPVPLKGIIKGLDGKPLPGATIRIKGMTLGTATDINGEYNLKLPSETGIRLIFSFVGMKDQEILFGGQKVLDIVLLEDIAQMEEVIVTGYSTRKVSEMTGSVQQFKGKDVAASATGGNLMNALKGHTTGLQISGSDGQPGQDGELLLRGMGTIFSESALENTSSTPLIVIDGVITDYKSISGVVAPGDVADITVLKDAASTAIYGSRAATGVIVVTTKKGAKDRMTVSLDAKMGVNVPNFRGMRYMNSQELLEYGEMTLRNWWDNNKSLRAKYPDRSGFVQDTLGTLRNNFDLTKSTDWRDLTYQTGLTKDVAMSIRGGGDKIQYYFSYNYFDEKGTKVGYNLTRHLFKSRMDFDVTKFLTFGVNLNGSFEKSITPNTSNMETYHPWTTPYNEDGSLKYNIENWTQFIVNPEQQGNALQDNKYNDITGLKNNLFGSFSGTLKPFSWMTISSTNTFTLINVNANDYKDSRTYGGNNSRNKNSNGVLKVSDERSWSFLTSNLLRLQRSFDSHNLSGLVGQEWYERHFRSSEINMYDQSVPGERNVGGFSKQGEKGDNSSVPEGQEKESGSFSVFSEVNYNYAGKYMASASFRTDASTNFGKDNRYGTFYSVSASWLASKEKFMEQQKVISNLKFRVSYGTSGKEAGMDYLNYTLYTTGMTTFDYYWNHPVYQSTYAAEYNQLGNDQLSWETAHNLNVGIDLGLINNRIGLSADWYERRNSDLIMDVNLAAAYGVGRQYRNVGEMENRGIELVLNTHTVKSPVFNWYTTLTFSYNDNKLTKLDQGKLNRSSSKTFYEGDNFDELKRVKVVGVDPETGRAQYERVEKDGSRKIVNTLTEATNGNGELSFVNIGLGRAPYWGGFTNTFSYKNWDLYVHSTYSLHYKVYNELKAEYTSGTRWTTQNLHKVPSQWKIWKEKGDQADIPMVNADPAFKQDLSSATSFCYTDASHWRISNIRLTYRLPQEWLKVIYLQSAALSFTCDNVYTLTSKEFAGNDPENVGGWAAPRRFIFGLNVTF